MITSREVDIYVNRYGIQACIPAVQYDSGRRIVFRVVDAVIPSGATSYIFIRKPSGNAEYILSTISGNTITVDMTNQSLSEYGINKAQIRIIKDEDVITSFDVVFDVKRSYADNAVESESGDMPAKLIDDIAMINARVDAFEALEDGSTTGDAELIDGRIGYNGTTYGTIGTAIRSQASSLDQRIRAIEDDSDISAEDVDYDGSGSGLSATNVQDAIDEVVDSIGSQTGSGVPISVRDAIFTLLSKAAYIETGLTDELEIIEEWASESATYSIRNVLSNCTTNNSATTINSGASYVATITANSSYVINNVTVTMGGDDITSSVYSGGTINIPSVTGNIVITATAVMATTSISVVYTQSGTVYDTDALNTLKADLVVTATYSDSTTATVPSADYTLSGTLEEGTSTVTVSYGGATTTFNVTVTANPIPYAFEGLFAYWDAIDNQATGTHNASATNWKDLMNGYEWSALISDGTQTWAWENNALAFNPTATGGTNSQNKNTFSCPRMGTGLRTLEVVFTPENLTGCVGEFTSDKTGLSNSGGQTIGVIANDNSFIIKSTQSGYSAGTITGIRSISATYDSSYASLKAYKNGQEVTTRVNSHSFLAYLSHDMMLGSQDTGTTKTYAFKGKVHAIRFYNRELTADEIASNYALDVSRYSLEV